MTPSLQPFVKNASLNIGMVPIWKILPGGTNMICMAASRTLYLRRKSNQIILNVSASLSLRRARHKCKQRKQPSVFLFLHCYVRFTHKWQMVALGHSMASLVCEMVNQVQEWQHLRASTLMHQNLAGSFLLLSVSPTSNPAPDQSSRI